MRILVTISRDWDAYEAIDEALWNATHGISHHKVIIVHGASQMDWYIAGFGAALGMDHEPHAAKWGEFAKAAGHIRNQEMVDSGADLCLAFIKNQSSGATGCAEKAEAAGIPTKRYIA